jgi:tape measure domain-containing protein
MATIGDIKIRIGGDIKSLEKSLKRAEFRLQRSGRKMAELGGRLSAAITLPILAIGGASLKIAGDMQALKMGMESMMGSAEAAKVEIAKLRKEALKPGLNFEQALKGSVRLQAVGVDADIARRALAGFGNALALVGGTGEQLDGVTLALSQIAAKGKISAEEINQLAERVPQIRSILKGAFGTADTEELQKLGIGFEEFVAKSIIELEKLPKAQSGIKNSIENTKLALQEAAAVIGERLFPIFEKISAVVLKVANTFSNLPVNIQDNIIQFGLLAAAMGPVLSVMGSLKIAAGTMAGSFATAINMIKGAFTLLLGPIGLVVAAVAAIGVAIIADIGPARKILLNLVNFFRQLYNSSSQFRGSVELLIFAFKGLWASVKLVFNRIIGGFKAIGKVALAILKGDFDQIKGILKDSFSDGVEDSKNKIGEILTAWQDAKNNIAGEKPLSLLTDADIDETIKKGSDLLKGIWAKIFGDGAAEAGGGNPLGILPTNFNRDPKSSGGSGSNKTDKSHNRKFKQSTDFLGGEKTSLLPEGLQLHVEKVTELGAKYQALRDEFKKTVNEFKEGAASILESGIESGLAAIGESIGNVISGAGDKVNVLGSLLSVVAGALEQLGKLAISTGVTMQALRKAFTNPFAAIAAGVGLIALSKIVAAKAKSITAPKLAKGGLAYGETLATVGDNPNSRIDPEVIAPLSKLKNMLGSPTVNVQVTGEGRLRGTDIVYIYDAIVNQKKRYGIG